MIDNGDNYIKKLLQIPTLMHNEQLAYYFDLLNKWNSKINLIAPNTLDLTITKSIVHANWIKRYICQDFALADIGAGSGIVSFILGTICANNIAMVEVDKRKAAFLGQLSMINKNLKVINKNIKDTQIECDVAIARALGKPQFAFDCIKSAAPKHYALVITSFDALAEYQQICAARLLARIPYGSCLIRICSA